MPARAAISSTTPRVVPGRIWCDSAAPPAPAEHHVHGGCGAFGQLPVAQQDGLGGAGVDRCWRSSTLASSAMDLMSQRAQRVSAAVTQATPSSWLPASGSRQRRAERKHRARDVRQRRMVAAVLGAAGHLPVHVLVAAGVALDERAEDAAPLRARVRIVHADGREAARQALAVRGEAERRARRTPA